MTSDICGSVTRTYELILDRMCAPDWSVLESFRDFTFACGIMMVEESTDRMLFIEQRERGELPAGIVGIPKGKFEREKDKSFLHCAIREFCEETGINPHVFDDDPPKRFAMILNRNRMRIVIVYACVRRVFPLMSACRAEIARIMLLTPRQLVQLPQKKMPGEIAQLVRYIANIAGETVSNSARQA